MKKIPLNYRYEEPTLYFMGMKVATDRQPILPPWGWDSRYILMEKNPEIIWDMYKSEWFLIPIKGMVTFSAYLFDGICLQTQDKRTYFLDNQGKITIEEDLFRFTYIIGYTSNYERSLNVVTYSDDLVLYNTGWIWNSEAKLIYQVKGLKLKYASPLHRGFFLGGVIYDIWGEPQGKCSDNERGVWYDI